MAPTVQTSSVTTTQASDEVGGGPVSAADERLLPLEPQAVDRRETARARNPAAVCRFRAFPARRARSMSPPREVDGTGRYQMFQATASAAVRGCRHAVTAVDVDPDVMVVGDERLASVQAHTHA